MTANSLRLVVLLAFASCTRQGTDHRANAPIAPAPAPPALDAGLALRTTPDATARANDAAPETERRAKALVLDREALATLERTGFSFGDFFQSSGKRAATLVESASYRDFISVLASDVARVERSDARSGVGLRHAHRLFDLRYLKAKNVHWDLVALVSRLDRLSFTPGECGDLRLIYRLAYDSGEGAKQTLRLPLTVALVLQGEPAKHRCKDAAQRFRPPVGLSGTELGDWLRSSDGPLHDGVKKRSQSTLLSNMQVVRWPSTVMPDLGGHAEYVLRQWQLGPAGIQAQRVFSTPDARSITARPDKRRRFRAFVTRSLTPQTSERLPVPTEFSARRSVAVTPGGFARRQNRPFSQALGKKALAETVWRGAGFASEAGLRRRLDEGTCAGCHQARTIAGFHILGLDPPNTPKVARLALPYSKHVANELVRREALIESLASGAGSARARGFTQRGASEPGKSGVPCGLGDPNFRGWTCESGLECKAQGDSLLGACAAKDAPSVGEACESGTLRSSFNGRRDRIRTQNSEPCAIGQCTSRKKGFPLGMCMTSCQEPGPGGTCGQIASSGFDRCITSQPFSTCLRDNVSPTGLRACDHETPCRDDYICAQSKSGSGACVPPYFLFQLRVDGHPAPEL